MTLPLMNYNCLPVITDSNAQPLQDVQGYRIDESYRSSNRSMTTQLCTESARRASDGDEIPTNLFSAQGVDDRSHLEWRQSVGRKDQSQLFPRFCDYRANPFVNFLVVHAPKQSGQDRGNPEWKYLSVADVSESLPNNQKGRQKQTKAKEIDLPRSPRVLGRSHALTTRPDAMSSVN